MIFTICILVVLVIYLLVTIWHYEIAQKEYMKYIETLETRGIELEEALRHATERRWKP